MKINFLQNYLQTKNIIKISALLAFILYFNITKSAIFDNDTSKYIFIGHCYQVDSPGYRVDYRLEKFDFSAYDGIWLGGDVSSEASLQYSTLEYINDIFSLSNPMTFWALGNHDMRNGNLEWITHFTQRETYYSHYSKGISYILMNTNLVPSDCYNMEKQYEIISNVCDTISESSHLVLLMHYGIWINIPGLPNPENYAHSSLTYWNSNCSDVNSSFVNSIYPKLIDVENRGVEVICIIGDMGASSKSFEMISDDGITFLGCGLYENSPLDNVLIFERAGRELIWKFENLDLLLLEQKR